MQNQGLHVPQFSYSTASIPHSNQPGANLSITPAPSVAAPPPPPPPPSVAPLLPPPSRPQYPFRPVCQQEFSFSSSFNYHVQPSPPLPNRTDEMGISHGGHIPPPGLVNAGQSYFIPPSSFSYSINQPSPQYPSHHNHGATTSVTYQSGSSIPPSQHSQMHYGIQPLQRQTDFVQHAPPPPAPPHVYGFSSFTPNSHSSLSTTPLTTAHGPSALPPPPPSSLPPHPPSPPPISASLPAASSSNTVLNARSQYEAVKVIRDSIQDANDQSVTSSAAESSCQGDYPSLPSKPKDDEIVHNIEVLSKFIAKNGPSFEDLARTKEAGNPKFAFLFGGEPGSMAAVGHEYFQWMKGKFLREHGESCSADLVSVPYKAGPSLMLTNPLNKPVADIPSPSSDVEMEDDIYHPGVEQTTSGLEDASGEVALSIKEGDHIDYPGLHASHISELSALEGDNRIDGQMASEVTPRASGPDGSPTGVIQRTNGSKASVCPSSATVGLEEAPRICARDNNLVKLLQEYESESSSEDEKELISKYKVKSDTAILDSDLNLDRVRAIGNDSAESQQISNLCKSPLSSGIAQMSESNKISCRKKDNNRNELEGSLVNKASMTSKVDEFGRMLRDVSDSDSDEAFYYAERRVEKERKDFRKRSPQSSRRRKSCSPRRRSEKRSPSCSWSPQRRARSPPYSRRIGTSGGVRVKNDGRSNRRECFDFRQGRCFRGTSCRFLHYDNYRRESIKHYKDRRQPPHERSREFESSPGSSYLKNKEVNNMVKDVTLDDTGLRARKLVPSVGVISEDLSIDGMDKEKQFASLQDKPCTSDELNLAQDSLLEKNQACKKVEDLHVDGVRSHLLQDACPSLPAEISDSVSKALSGRDQLLPLPMETSSISHISQDQVFARPTCLPEPENVQPHANQNIIASSVHRENLEDLSQHESNFQNNSLVGGFQWRHPTLSHPSSLPDSDFSSLPPSDFQLNSSSQQMHLQGFSAQRYSYQPLHPDFHPTFTPSMPWNNLQAPLCQPPPRIDNLSLPTKGLLEIGSNGEQRFMHPENSHRQLLPSDGLISVPGQVTAGQAEPYSGGTLQLRTFSGEEYVVKNSLSMPSSSLNDGGTVGGPSWSVYPPSFSDNIGSKLPRLTHYNPYASTFEQVPVSFNMSSTAYRVETDSNYGMSNVPSTCTFGTGPRLLASPHISNISQVPVLPVVSGVSMHVSVPVEPGYPSYQDASSTQSKKMQGSEQYDPLFDSIDLSSRKAKKLGPSHADDSASLLRAGSMFRPPDVEENNKQKDCQLTVVNYVDKDSVGETGTDEVGGLENVSQENPMDTGGEIEIDQFQSSPRKKKKNSRDSKSMKLYRIAIANFVKEILKPSWRQGTMSKEAFKTIVRKTVEKVSSAMQDRRLPKSQAKINQFVESSERKLTKLVMGYVDKYVKP